MFDICLLKWKNSYFFIIKYDIIIQNYLTNQIDNIHARRLLGIPIIY